MKHLLITLLALTCATLHAQSVSMLGSGASVHGEQVVTQTPVSVDTNLTVTGELIPDATDTTGTNYVQIPGGVWGNPAWTNAVNGAWLGANPAYGLFFGSAVWFRDTSPIGGYQPTPGLCTGTAVVAYYYITNYVATTSSVSVSGVAIP